MLSQHSFIFFIVATHLQDKTLKLYFLNNPDINSLNLGITFFALRSSVLKIAHDMGCQTWFKLLTRQNPKIKSCKTRLRHHLH